MSVFDAHTNLAYSTLAGSLTTGATSCVVQAGHGARFPTPPFNVTIWPASALAIPTNAEIARVTAIATDTLTITRAQEGTTAKAFAANDQIAATITTKTITDIEGATVLPARLDTQATLQSPDCNLMTSHNGWHQVWSGTANVPAGFVTPGQLLTIFDDSNNGRQQIWENGSTKVWERFKNAGVWSAWVLQINGVAPTVPVSLTVPSGGAYWFVSSLGVMSSPHYELPDAATSTVNGYVLVPPGVTAATLRVVLAASATTGNVRMAGYVASAQGGETLAPASWDILNAGLATVAMAGTAWFRRDLTFSLTGLLGGDVLSLAIQRQGADALDTMAATLCLFGAWLEPA